VRLGRLVRYAEWVTAEGEVVRVGIPSRLDGAPRIELQRSRRLDSPRERWGLEYLR
jgi:hypothetical protein